MRIGERLRFAAHLARDPGKRRFAARWLASTMERDHLMRARLPWLTFSAIEHLDTIPLAGRRVFEWGSGGSTLYFLKRGARVVSVEHDAAWFERVARAAAGADTRLVTSRREPAQHAPTSSSPADPDAYLSAHPPERGASFRAYASAIDDFPDATFDLVLVDGRARPSCIVHGVRKVAPGGVLVLDNADRRYYLEEAGRVLDGWSCTTFSGPGPISATEWETRFFVRPPT